MKKLYPHFVCILVLIFFSGYANDSSWKLAVDKDGIKVYTRPAPGCPLDEFMATAEIDASAATIEKILRDVDAQPDWMADCLHAKVLKIFDMNHMVCYNVLNLPWPLSDRDLLIDTIIVKSADGKKFSFEMSAFPDDIIPLDSRYVRIRDFRARCIVEEVRPGTCAVVYINRVNPMAPVPDAIANGIARNNPFNTLKGMKKMVQLDTYRDKQVNTSY